VYAAIAALFTWPLPLRATTAILGDGKDGWMETWNFWWLARSVGAARTPYDFNTVFAPNGVTDYLHALNPIGGVVTLPAQWALGPAFAYNLGCWLALVATALGAFLLCREVTGNTLAAFAGGLFLGFAPRQFAQLLSHLSVASIEFVPFGLWFLMRAMKTGGRARLVWAAAAAACLAASYLAHSYTAIFQGLAYLVVAAFFAGERSAGPALWARTRLAVGVLALAFVITLPLTIATARQALGPDAPGHNEGTTAEVETYSADLVAYIVPQPFSPLWGDAARSALAPLPATLIEKAVMPGLVVLLLGLLGALHPQSRRAALPWAALAVAGFVLSLGPRLHVGGTNTGVPLPGELLYALPLSGLLRVPARFSVLVSLGLAVSASLGLHALASKLSSGRANAISLLVVAVALVELAPLPFPVSSPQPGAPLEAAGPAGGGALLEVPFDQYDTRPLQGQMATGVRLVGGYLSRMPVYPPGRGVPPFAQLGLNRPPGAEIPLPGAPAICGGAPASDYAALLQLAGTGPVALHLDRMKPGDSRLGLVRSMFPAGSAEEAGQVELYRVPPGPAPSSLFGAVEDIYDWGPVEESSYRWTGGSQARVHVWSGAARTASLELTLSSFGVARSVTPYLNGRADPTQRLEKDAPVRLTVGGLLDRGFNTVTLAVSGPAVSPASIGMGADSRPLTVRLQACKLSAAP
jgi:hypothetical protein